MINTNARLAELDRQENELRAAERARLEKETENQRQLEAIKAQKEQLRIEAAKQELAVAAQQFSEARQDAENAALALLGTLQPLLDVLLQSAALINPIEAAKNRADGIRDQALGNYRAALQAAVDRGAMGQADPNIYRQQAWADSAAQQSTAAAMFANVDSTYDRLVRWIAAGTTQAELNARAALVAPFVGKLISFTVENKGIVLETLARQRADGEQFGTII